MIFLTLLFIKHFIVDFLLQTDEMVKGKGVYGSFVGIEHSFQHFVYTFVLAWFFTIPSYALGLAIIDFIFHYHIDYVKLNMVAEI